MISMLKLWCIKKLRLQEQARESCLSMLFSSFHTYNLLIMFVYHSMLKASNKVDKKIKEKRRYRVKQNTGFFPRFGAAKLYFGLCSEPSSEKVFRFIRCKIGSQFSNRNLDCILPKVIINLTYVWLNKNISITHSAQNTLIRLATRLIKTSRKSFHAPIW